ncbi:MAG: hypothetical protein IJK83_04335 [Clostridiales bacterium]|nr:hypothetical protein [Clostridiales bacterium]MBR2820648.1 hypothetical protein [Clostridiales bacterium]
MGIGLYRAGDWMALRKSNKLSEASTAVQIYNKKTADNCNRSNLIKNRESRDNDDSPESTPVIIGFDVTASMGYLAKEIAVNSLNNMISAIIDDKAVSDPQVLCAAIGDVKSDCYPLQVTQFESDIRMVRQLMTLCIEGGGGGNDGESYNLLWYFASRHTNTDCYEKRKKKGILFTIGDDKCHPDLSRTEIFNAFADTVPYTLSNEELIREVSSKYDIFHLYIENDTASDTEVCRYWSRLLPGRSAPINKKDISLLSDLIVAVMLVNGGKTHNEVLSGMDQKKAERIARSLSFIEIKKAESNTISF